MMAHRIRAGVVFVLISMAFAVAAAWKPTEFLSDRQSRLELETLFPRTFAQWRVDDRVPVQLISPDQQALLNKIYNQTLSRSYIDETGTRVMLSVAYGGDQSDGTRAHRPEVCYPAQGFQLLSQKNSSVALDGQALPVRQLVARLAGRIEPISYWVTVGDKIALSGTEQKLAQLNYSMRGLVPDGMLVRVSTIDADPANAWAVQARFIADLERAVAPEWHDRLFGKANQ